MVQIPPTSREPEELVLVPPQPVEEYREEQAALLMLRQFRSRRPLRHGVSLPETLADLVEEWFRHA